MKGQKFIPKPYPSSEVLRCRAITKSGHQCGKEAAYPGYLCGTHFRKKEQFKIVELVEVELR